MRILVLTVLLSVSIASLADAPKGYPFTSFDEGLTQAKSSNKLLFIYFGRHGCGWCEKTNKDTFSNAKLKQLYSRNYQLIYVDTESGDRLTMPSGETVTESEFGSRMNIIATPVFVYMDHTGKILFRAPGFKTVKDFTDFDRYVQGGHYKNKSINEFLSSKK